MGDDITQPHGVVPAGRGEGLTVRAESNTLDRVWLIKLAKFPVAGNVPEASCGVRAGCRGLASVGAERHTVYSPLCPRSGVPSCRWVPTSQRRTFLSPPLVASVLPLGLNATSSTMPL